MPALSASTVPFRRQSPQQQQQQQQRVRQWRLQQQQQPQPHSFGAHTPGHGWQHNANWLCQNGLVRLGVLAAVLLVFLVCAIPRQSLLMTEVDVLQSTLQKSSNVSVNNDAMFRRLRRAASFVQRQQKGGGGKKGGSSYAGAGKKKKNRPDYDGPPRTKSLHLIGERHSGTNWITDHLRDCFEHEVEVVPRYKEFKHWFQTPGASFPDVRRNFDHTVRKVLIAQFRNPFHWTESMRRLPYHSPEHFGLDWPEFVTKPWTMPRYDADVAFEGVTQQTSPDVPCARPNGKKLHYKPYQLIPCNADVTFLNPNGEGTSHALYELKHDGSGQPYQNILELRRDKIANFVDVLQRDQSWLQGAHAVRYEDLVQQGTAQLIREVEAELQVTAKCQPVAPRPHWTDRALSTAYVDYLKEHVHWETEKLVGYAPDFLDTLAAYGAEKGGSSSAPAAPVSLKAVTASKPEPAVALAKQ